MPFLDWNAVTLSLSKGGGEPESSVPPTVLRVRFLCQEPAQMG